MVAMHTSLDTVLCQAVRTRADAAAGATFTDDNGGECGSQGVVLVGTRERRATVWPRRT